MASENHYTTAGTVLSGFEHDTTYGQKYQTISSTVFWSLRHLLITNYLEMKTDANYRRRVQTQPCSTCTTVTTCLDASQIRIVDDYRQFLSTTDFHHIQDYAVLSVRSQCATMCARRSLEPH
jgi:hypothetical protein